MPVNRVQAKNAFSPSIKPAVTPLAAETSPIPSPTEPLSEQLAADFRPSFDVKSIGANSLLLEKPSSRSRTPALFEEAILLGKLRAILKSSPGLGPEAAVNFQGGKVMLKLPAALPRATASAIFSKMLALDGVNGLQVVFGK